MTSDATGAAKGFGPWSWLAILILAAGAFLVLPIVPCGMCADVGKAIRADDLKDFECPCCGKSRRVSLAHAWITDHRRHVAELNRLFAPGGGVR